MRLGRVIGAVWATKKRPELTGYPLLLVQPEGESGCLAAADAVGAGPGERVLVVEGSTASQACGGAADACIVAIVDAVQTRQEERI